MKGYYRKRKHYTVQKAVRPRMMQKLNTELSTAMTKVKRDDVVVAGEKWRNKFKAETETADGKLS